MINIHYQINYGIIYIIEKYHRKKGNGFGYTLFNHNSDYVNTISARYNKDGSEILISQDNKNPRKLTPREALLIQGFPSTFKIVCSDTQVYKQSGNSVCINVIYSIAMEILKLNIFYSNKKYYKIIDLDNVIKYLI